MNDKKLENALDNLQGFYPEKRPANRPKKEDEIEEDSVIKAAMNWRNPAPSLAQLKRAKPYQYALMKAGARLLLSMRKPKS